MGKVITHMTMSLDGFIAQPDDNPAELFDWYQAGDVPVEHANKTSTTSTSTKPAQTSSET
jgi:hypothetical protein